MKPRPLPRVMLEPRRRRRHGRRRHTALTLRVSAFPAQVTIENVDTNTTQAFTMKAQTKTVQLQAGHYEVRIEKGGEVQGARAEPDGQVRVSSRSPADFKDAE